MKKVTLFLISIFIFSGTILNAQPNKRAAAFNYLKMGDLAKAKDAIDQASVHPKTANDPRTWWYKGQIYQAIKVSKDEEYKSIATDAADSAFVAFKKALLYNFKDPALQKLNIDNNQTDYIKFLTNLQDRSTKYVDQQISMDIFALRYPSLANILVNKGVNQYSKEKDFKNALKSFEESLFASTLAAMVDTSRHLDTTVIYYAALSADKAKDIKSAKEYFKTLIKLEYGKNDEEKASMYYFLSKEYKDEKDTTHYLKTLNKGIEKYPDGSSALVVELINYYLSSNKTEDALNYLNVAVEKDTTNPNFYFARGSLYDVNLKQPEKAIPDYKKAIALDPDYFDPNYNLGALYYNQAVEQIKKAQEETDNTKYNKMVEKAKGVMKVALPYLEKAHEINPTDKNTMISLKELYYRLGNVEKSEEIGKILKGE